MSICNSVGSGHVYVYGK